jgi:hypothetical protein
MKNRIATAYLLYVCSFPTFAEVRAPNLFLQTYGSQCNQVVTSDVGESLQNIQKMASIVDELKADQDCGGSTQVASALSRYSLVYADYQTRDENVQSKSILEQKIARYTVLLSDPSIDAESKNFFRKELVSAQANLISTDGNLKHFSTFSGRESRVARDLMESVNTYVGNLSQNTQCVEKKGTKVASLVSSALLTTSAFATGGTSLALATGGVVVQTGAIYLKERKSNNVLKDVDTIETPLAIRCTSQVLTDQYCKNEETKRLLQERQSALNNNESTKSKLESLNLLAYQLTGLSKWIEEVYSGSEINSAGDLINRSKPIEQAHLLKKITNMVQSFTSSRRSKIVATTNSVDRTTSIAKAIDSIAEIMIAPEGEQGQRIENPILNSRTRELLPFKLYRTDITKVPSVCGSGDDPCKSFTDYVANQKDFILTIEDFNRAIDNATIIISNTRNEVNLELAKKVTLDAYTVLVNSNRVLSGEVNAFQGLAKIRNNADKISASLKRMGCANSPVDCETPLNQYYPQFSNVLKTKQLVESVMGLIQESYVSGPIPEASIPKECKTSSLAETLINKTVLGEDEVETKSFQIITCISKILKIQERGNSFLLTKVRDMVSYDLEARLKNGELGDAVTHIANTSRKDLVESILNSYKVNDSTISIDDVILGLETAQNNTTQLMETFYDFFEKDFKKSLKSTKLSAGEKKDLCLRVVPFLREDAQDLLKLSYDVCKNVSYQSYKNGPKISFADHVQYGSGVFKSKFKLKGTVASRLCFYRNYSRKNRLIDEQNTSRDILENLNAYRKIKTK